MAAVGRSDVGDGDRSDSALLSDVGDGDRTDSASLNDAMRARAEANRQRARLLRQARARDPGPGPAPGPASAGGGFLPESGPAPAVRVAAPSAPLPDPTERPPCLECGRGIALSYLLDTFGHAVCDECRDAEGAHSLVTRTEALSEFPLGAHDLDGGRGAALACVRRRNPHRAGGADMRLYLRAQVEARALAVWGGAEELLAELARREERRTRGAARRGARRMRALRMDVRSSLFRAPRAAHEHAFAAETYIAAEDRYERACACGHRETYEKM